MSDLFPALPLPVTLRWERVSPTAPGMPAFLAWARAATVRLQVGEPARVPGGRKPVSDATVDVYLSIWSTWIEWLAGRQVNWEKATASHTREFLNTRTPSRRRAKPTPAQPSTVTKRRYWRVLREIYQAAIHHGLVVGNPASIAMDGLPEAEIADSVYLDADLLGKLRHALATAVRTYVPGPASDLRAWQKPRDLAILAVLLDTGAKTAEVTALRPEHISWTREGLYLTLGSDIPRARQRAMGKLQRIKRTLQLSETGTAALQLWLATRQGKADECSLRGQQLNAWLFFSQKGAVSRGGEDRQMTHQPIYTLASDFITSTLGEEVFARGQTHTGPTVIRNSVMMEWIVQGLDLSEVNTRAGLGQVSQLGRLTKLVAR
ncbi:MAG: tyrosine-type recombinase/integrase [Rhodoferax sp.]|nr:tyrosine-type recombinase/integrase [Rhodoferax sp.]